MLDSFAKPSLDKDAFLGTVYNLSLTMIGVAIGIFVVGYLEVSLLSIAAEKQSMKIRQAYFKAVIRQDIGWFDQNNSGEIVTRIMKYVFMLLSLYNVCEILFVFLNTMRVVIARIYRMELARNMVKPYGKQESLYPRVSIVADTLRIYILRFFTTFITGFVVAFYYGWELSLVLLACVPVLAICGYFMMEITGGS